MVTTPAATIVASWNAPDEKRSFVRQFIFLLRSAGPASLVMLLSISVKEIPLIFPVPLLRTTHLPLKFGVRLFRKASIPSSLSSVWIRAP